MFNFFPKIYYKINDYDFLKVVDIGVYAQIKDYVKSFRYIAYSPYTVQNGETPESVSQKMYGTPKYAYMILLVNDMHNIYEEWPMSYEVFNDYIEYKYGNINYATTTPYKYYGSNGIEYTSTSWLELTDPGKYSYSIYEYEQELNTKKSFIKLLDQGKIIQFEVKLQELLNTV